MTTQSFTRGQVLTPDMLNELVDSFTAFQGGTVPNATTFTGTGTGSVAVSPVLSTAAPVADAAQVLSTYNVAGSGGTSGTVSSNVRAYTSVSGAPNAYIWSVLGVLDYAGSGGNGQHVAVYGQGLRRTWNAGATVNNPEIWGGVFEARDMTGQASSVTNNLLALEVDLFCNGLDDANKRQGIVLVLGRHNQSGAYAQADAGIRLSGFTALDSYKIGIDMAASFSTAGLDFRTSTRMSGHTVWLSTGHDIAMDLAGVNTIYHDAAAIGGLGATRFSGNVEIDGAQFYLPNAAVTLGASLLVAANRGLRFSTQVNPAAAATATFTNAPVAGNPIFYIPMTVNGVNGCVPFLAVP